MAITYGHKVNNRNVKPRTNLSPQALSLLGIRRDAQNLSFDALRVGYEKALEENPNLSKSERKRSLKELVSIVDIFDDYVENIHDNFDVGSGFLLMGNNDNGKSTLVGVWAREAYRARYDAKVITAEEISHLSRDFDNPDSLEKIEDLIYKYDFLVIDEMGKETEGAGKYNQIVLERILKTRIEKYELPTSVVTNLSPDDFKLRYGNSIYSVLQYQEAIIMTYSLFFRKPREVVRSKRPNINKKGTN